MASGDAGSMHRYLSYVGWKPIPSGIPGTYFARVHELGTLTCARRNSTSWHALVLDENGWDFYISHLDAESSKEADTLVRVLGGRGKVWCESKTANPKEMETAIRKSKVFILIVSKSYFHDLLRIQEVRWAVHNNTTMALLCKEGAEASLDSIFRQAAEVHLTDLDRESMNELRLSDQAHLQRTTAFLCSQAQIPEHVAVPRETSEREIPETHREEEIPETHRE
eukprot:2693766-Rhodomonas_salina.1